MAQGLLAGFDLPVSLTAFPLYFLLSADISMLCVKEPKIGNCSDSVELKEKPQRLIYSNCKLAYFIFLKGIKMIISPKFSSLRS